MRRSFWIIWVSCNCQNKYLYKRKAEGDLRHAEEKVMWRQAEILQAANTTRECCHLPEARRGKEWISPKKLWKDPDPTTLRFLTSVLQNSQSCFEPPRLWYFVTVATGTNTAVFSSSSLSYLWFTFFAHFRSAQFSRSVMSDSLQPYELQHARPPCPWPTPGVYPNSCPLSQWCHLTISSSVIPFSSCLQSLDDCNSLSLSLC